MKSAEDRIRQLAAAQSLDSEDAARLLDALRPPAIVPHSESVLANPFARHGGGTTAIAGGVIAALALLVSQVGVRFDGALDVHTVGAPVALPTALVDQLVALPLTAVVFWSLARTASRSTRVVDVLGVVGVSRAPSMLLAIPLGLYGLRSSHAAGASPAAGLSFVLGALILLGLGGLGAQIYLLFVGFRTVTGIRGGALTWRFIAALVVAEVLSKVVLSLAI